MILSVDKRYEIIFLSHHPMGPQLGVKAVAKAIKSAKSTVQYWLNRWKESKARSVLDDLVAQRKKWINESVSSLPPTIVPQHAAYSVS